MINKLVKISSRGRIVIPTPIFTQLKWKDGEPVILYYYPKTESMAVQSIFGSDIVQTKYMDWNYNIFRLRDRTISIPINWRDRTDALKRVNRAGFEITPLGLKIALYEAERKQV